MERFHHPQSGATTTNNSDLKRGKKRGSYNCGRCGLPKKGHVCNLTPSTTNTATTSPPTTDSSNSARCSTIDPSSHVHLRRALSFDDADDLRSGFHSDFDDIDEAEPVFDYPDIDPDSSGCLPASCLWEILRRLPPAGILSAARVCKGWRETTKKIWRAAEVLRLRVPPKAQFGFVGSLLQKCSGLVTLSLRLESSDLDSMMLACIAFSCPNLEALEITKSQSSINRITGGELGRFVADKRCLKSLKMEGCSSLGSFSLCSSSLGTLWLSDLCSLSKMAFNCPNLREISLEFSRHENDRTDLVAMVDGMVRGCPRLQNVHISSFRLSHAVVLALTAGQLRGLRMLSLVLGADITDASVASIASSYPNLELLDLSGSSISDSGIGMICNVFPDTLSRLLLALCPNITSSGIQFATAELPLLELMDCGMTICDPNSQDSTSEIGDHELSKPPNSKFHLIYQKLIIKHNHLKKLSLWGCSGLDALYLNCPQLDDLNLNSCKNLHPERLLLQCPSLRNVHASDCEELLVGAIRSQLKKAASPEENLLSCKRLADGSKRIRVPPLVSSLSSDNGSKRRRVGSHHCNIHVC
ncbi:F-box/LRR-repeat protein 17-like isoform X1 [Cucurbita pepo subsp. pepo]|uniref:F-box/LRR-repeat protein 17-like isoform X1 n=1 Tax=Cucurbita pepo subsp. pepo TaxID=3664 RepID=UPI000C9D800C|nr:F-box/LRR-repeat protein 17-like isoform X1 [Cucurbita pepo subsp. pepo]